jgi:hypothetical protein
VHGVPYLHNVCFVFARDQREHEGDGDLLGCLFLQLESLAEVLAHFAPGWHGFS